MTTISPFRIPKRHHSLLALVLPRVFARDGEVVPDGLGPLEVQTVDRNVATAFGFIPGGHQHIVVTMCGVDKWIMRLATSDTMFEPNVNPPHSTHESASPGNTAHRDFQQAPERRRLA